MQQALRCTPPLYEEEEVPRCMDSQAQVGGQASSHSAQKVHEESEMQEGLLCSSRQGPQGTPRSLSSPCRKAQGMHEECEMQEALLCSPQGSPRFAPPSAHSLHEEQGMQETLPCLEEAPCGTPRSMEKTPCSTKEGSQGQEGQEVEGEEGQEEKEEGEEGQEEEEEEEGEEG